MQPKEIAKEIIENNMHMTLATCDGQDPWVAPVFYAVDQNYNLYFASALDSVHAQHIGKNPHVAVAIFEAEGRGVQIKTICSLVDEKDYARVMEYFQKKLFPDEEERAKHPIDTKKYSGTNRRIFKCVPSKVYVLDSDPHVQDRRLEVQWVD